MVIQAVPVTLNDGIVIFLPQAVELLTGLLTFCYLIFHNRLRLTLTVSEILRHSPGYI